MDPSQGTTQKLLAQVERLRRQVQELASQPGAPLLPQDELWRALLDQLPDQIYFKDREGRYCLLNRAHAAWLGLDNPADAVGKVESDFLYAEHARESAEEDQAVLNTETPMAGKTERRVRRDGKECWFSTSKTCWLDAAGKVVGILGISRDVTQHRATENLRAQQTNLAAVGVGVMAAQGPPRLEPLNLNVLLAEVVSSLKASVARPLTVEVQVDDALWTVLGDLHHMRQALLHACRRAADAMRVGGQLTIETANVFLDVVGARLVDGRVGSFVRLRITDNGHESWLETASDPFDPEFLHAGPTPAMSSRAQPGAPLGLAITLGVIKQLRGWVDTYREPEQGTRFDMYLPRWQPPQTSPATNVSTSTPAPGRGEMILVVDDDERIAQIAAVVLREANYRVLVAHSGADALRLYRNSPCRIDLVLLDLHLGDMLGREVFEQLILDDPQAAVLFWSGYSLANSNLVSHSAVRGFLGKPFQVAEMLRMINEALAPTDISRRSAPA